MKRFCLLIVAVVLALPMMAQDDNYSPSIYMFSKSAGPLNDTAQMQIIELYKVRDRGFQQMHSPNFILSGGKGFTLGVSGFVNFRTAYDFGGIVQNKDFVTYNIPVPGNYATRSRLFMDATTSRLAFKATAQNRRLGPIVSYIETDFRGGTNGADLRLRIAYVTFKGFLFGRDVTTFCDLSASPTTIDFQGPNAYTFNFNEMIRYTRTLGDNRWKLGIALEMPQLSASTTANLTAIPQRIPDVPLYAQYNWGENRDSHLRLSGVIRTLSYHNVALDKNRNATGWGVQLSTLTHLTRKLSFAGQILYGEGITPYVNDLEGNNLDLVQNPTNHGSMMTVPALGWFGSFQYNITRNLFASAGYSQVKVFQKNGYDVNDQYRLGQYCFGNVFWNLTPSLQVAVEYLYGTRRNMDHEKNHANRLQAMVQYNF